MHINNNTIRRYAGFIGDKVVLKGEVIPGNLKKQFDFLMIFLPANTLLGGIVDWKVYAYVHNYLSIYNDR